MPRLRRYHEAGVLVPAHVDPVTSYRMYTVEQLEQAGTIRRLRDVELVDQLIREEQRMTTSVQLMEVVLQVDDVDTVVEFYRGVLGFEFQADDHKGAAPVHYDACGGAWDPDGFFLFTVFPANGSPTTTRFGFGVPDLDEVWDRAKHSGAALIAPPEDHGYMPRAAVIGDPAGNTINLYQRAGDW